MNAHRQQIWGELTDDAQGKPDLGDPPPDTEWNEVPLPRCPDCGGDLVWDEADDGPGSLKCAGRPIGSCDGRPMYCSDGGCGSLFDVEARRVQVTLQRKQFHLA
jgi:hypothetical protein